MGLYDEQDAVMLTRRVEALNQATISAGFCIQRGSLT